jgi:hypothetical protein
MSKSKHPKLMDKALTASAKHASAIEANLPPKKTNHLSFLMNQLFLIQTPQSIFKELVSSNHPLTKLRMK